MTHAASAFYGSFFHTPVYGSFEYLENALIEVDERGAIARVLREGEPEHAQALAAHRTRGTLTELGANRYGLPGFVDIHVHAPQWPQAALALDEPLYLWLEQRTFPLESRFADLDFARTVYRDLVQQLMARGSTTTESKNPGMAFPFLGLVFSVYATAYRTASARW